MKRNDTSIAPIGGTATPLNHEHLYVAMVRETIHIDLYKDNYETRAEFIFTNHGEARDVLMGFPERGGGMDGPQKTSLFEGFSSTVDGIPIATKRVRATEDYLSYEAYWTKTVPFGKNQTRRVQVRYRSTYGAGIDGVLAAYDFTGGNWLGKVSESVVIVTPHAGAPLFTYARLDEKEQKILNPKKPQRFVWRNWEAEGLFFLYQYSIVKGKGRR